MIAKATSSNAVEVLSYSDYYPHGGVLPGRNYVSSPAYKLGYQGQEKDGETNFYNFELRQFDPRLGRWFNPDPMGQYYSPYLAMGNNPVSSIDPTGGSTLGGMFNDMPLDNYIDGMEYYKSNGGGWEGMTPGDREIVQGLNHTSYGWQNTDRRIGVVSLGGYDAMLQLNRSGEIGFWSKLDAEGSASVSRANSTAFGVNISEVGFGEHWNGLAEQIEAIIMSDAQAEFNHSYLGALLGMDERVNAIQKGLSKDAGGLAYFMDGVSVGVREEIKGTFSFMANVGNKDMWQGMYDTYATAIDDPKKNKATLEMAKEGMNKLLNPDAHDVGEGVGHVLVIAGTAIVGGELAGGCFIAGTTVWAENGNKKIEKIVVGDKVNAYNPETGTITLKPVLQAYEREVNKLVKVEFENEIIYTTLEHPFFIKGSWVDAGKLKEGDALFLHDKTTAPVQKVTIIDTVVKVYNITVETDHDYFVSSRKVLVHNIECSFNSASGYRDALQPFNNTKNALTKAGRALTKHPNIAGGSSGSQLLKSLGAKGVNQAASNALKYIMRNGTATTKFTKQFGSVIDFKLPSGMGARFQAGTNQFIGFLGQGL